MYAFYSKVVLRFLLLSFAPSVLRKEKLANNSRNYRRNARETLEMKKTTLFSTLVERSSLDGQVSTKVTIR